MNNKKEKYLIVFVLLLLLGIGYAALNSTLNIIGISNIAKSNWDVHFANITLKNDSVEIDKSIYPDAQAATIDVLDPTKLSYNVLLSEPGDFYEFTVDVVNDGSIDAMISSIESKIRIGNGEETLLTNETLPEYMLYSVTYSNGTEIDLPHELKPKEKDTLLVRVEFKKDITNAQFEEAVGKLLNFKLNIDYVQSNLGEVANNQNTFVDSNPCTYEGELVPGATYMGTQYKYVYKQNRYGNDLEEDGWSMQLIDPSSTDPITETMCSTINGKPIVDMRQLFEYSQAESIDLSSFNTYHVTNMASMFSDSEVKNLDLRSFNTSNVTDMSGMFSNCYAETIDVSSFDISNVTYMTDMFSWVNLEELDLSSFDFSANPSANVESIFAGNIEKIKFKNETSEIVLNYKDISIPGTITYNEPTVYPSTAYAVAISSSDIDGTPNHPVFRNNVSDALKDWIIINPHENKQPLTFLKYDINTNTNRITNNLLGLVVNEDVVGDPSKVEYGTYYLDRNTSYETNRDMVLDALKPDISGIQCSEGDSKFTCYITGLYVEVRENGYRFVGNYYDGGHGCVIESDGESYCS